MKHGIGAIYHVILECDYGIWTINHLKDKLLLGVVGVSLQSPRLDVGTRY